ncbi:flagellar hook-length control protein FliK [Hydrogenovibrio halophilus]|uniref:flagellar hook-length control protein FliK n=1 Tax=Hydrogenovibrio halophilus TaxID=373391 RepID=UPI0003713906|nr:flagellar hook-length control protein FliK [Hydrogenovibrio halophilus]
MMEKTTINSLLSGPSGADKTDARQSLPKGASGFTALLNRLAEESDMKMSEVKKGQWLQAFKGEASLSDIGLDQAALDQLNLTMNGELSEDMAQNLQAVLQQIEHKMPGVSFDEALSQLDLDAETQDWLTSLEETLSQLNLPGLVKNTASESGAAGKPDAKSIEDVLKQLQALLASDDATAAKPANPDDESSKKAGSLVQGLEKALAKIEQLAEKIQAKASDTADTDKDKTAPGLAALHKLADKLESLTQLAESTSGTGSTDRTDSKAIEDVTESSEPHPLSGTPLQALAEKLASLAAPTERSAAEASRGSEGKADVRPASTDRALAANADSLNQDAKLNEEAAKRRQEAEAKPTFKVDGRDMKVETTRWAEAKNELKQELRAEMQQAGASSSGGQSGQSGQNQQSLAQQLAQQQWQQSQQQRQLAQSQQQATKMAADGSVTEEQKAERVEKLLGSLGMDTKNGLPGQLQTLSQPSRSPNWSQALGHRVLYMANHKLQEAKITLNPEKLGSIQVKLNVDKDQAVHVSMLTQQGTTREAIEQAMPKLKEMLENAGMKFGSMDVSEERQSFAGDQAQEKGEGQRAQGQTGQSGEDHGEEATASSRESVLATSNNLVDYYA